MAFLTLNGTVVPCASNQTQQGDEEHRIDRDRMFDGTYRMSRQGVYRAWIVTTNLLTEADANTLLALIRTDSPPLTANGDLVGGVDTGVMPIPGTADPVQTAQGFRRRLTFQLKETQIPAPVDTSASVFLFVRSGYGLFTDWAKTTAAVDGDLIRVWADQSGNGNDLLAGTDDPLDDPDGQRPTLDGVALRFGLSGRKCMTCSTATRNAWKVIGPREYMIAVKAVDDPPATNATSGLLFLSGSGDQPTYFPDTSGHIHEGFAIDAIPGTQTIPIDCGDPATSLRDSFVVWGVGSSDTEWKARLNNVIQKEAVPALPTNWGGGEMTIGFSNAVTLDYFAGWIKHFAIFNGVLTDSQRLAWYNFMRGATTSPPLP